ncbi:MAG: glycosyltransferase [Treponema sp.]|jgi:glycosyltransferase involved in cell wall biosynthesis|nr:glycosyltransferase [Treponema sp.]
MSSPLLSIIVPVFNAEKWLAQCLDSIVNQTFGDFECILVDDGSSDASPAVCESFAKTDSRIRVLHLQNSGASSARNAGIDAAKGELIAFVDSDDFLVPDAYETMIRHANAAGSDVVCTGFCTTKNDVTIPDPLPDGLSCVEAAACLEKKGLFGFIWNKLYRKSILIKNNIKFADGISFGEDLLFNLRYFCFCGGVSVTSSATYIYRVHTEKSLSGRMPDFEQALFRYRETRKWAIKLDRTLSGDQKHSFSREFAAKYFFFAISVCLCLYCPPRKDYNTRIQTILFLKKNNAECRPKGKFTHFECKLFFLCLQIMPAALFDCFLKPAALAGTALKIHR